MAEAAYFAIVCEENNDLMWSNNFGWVDTPTFDLFSTEEKEQVNLPVGGRWVQITFPCDEGGLRPGSSPRQSRTPNCSEGEVKVAVDKDIAEVINLLRRDDAIPADMEFDVSPDGLVATLSCDEVWRKLGKHVATFEDQRWYTSCGAEACEDIYWDEVIIASKGRVALWINLVMGEKFEDHDATANIDLRKFESIKACAVQCLAWANDDAREICGRHAKRLEGIARYLPGIDQLAISEINKTFHETTQS